MVAEVRDGSRCDMVVGDGSRDETEAGELR